MRNCHLIGAICILLSAGANKSVTRWAASERFHMWESDALFARVRNIFSRMLVARQILGERGERIAEQFLVKKGGRILDRRFRSGHRDIDLVAEWTHAEGGHRTVAFVEVKARVSADYGGPLGAVHWRKQRELVKAARDWMGRFHC